jgi:hypothetical protein
MNFYAFFVISDNNEFLVRFQSSQIPAMRCPDFTLRCYIYIYIYIYQPENLMSNGSSPDYLASCNYTISNLYKLSLILKDIEGHLLIENFVNIFFVTSLSVLLHNLLDFDIYIYISILQMHLIFF